MKNLKVKYINSYLVHSLEMLLETVELIHIRFTIPLLVNPFINTILILTETKDLNAKLSSLQQLFAPPHVPVTAKAHFLSTLGLTENNQVKRSSSKYSSSSPSRSSYCSNSSSSYGSNSSYDLINGWGVFTQPSFLSQQLLKRDYHG